MFADLHPGQFWLPASGLSPAGGTPNIVVPTLPCETVPEGPGGPGLPVGPVPPVGPGAPVGPVGPVGPVPPVGPGGPGEPGVGSDTMLVILPSVVTVKLGFT
jgi:hypothetical protein